jgi:hypothetical protein
VHATLAVENQSGTSTAPILCSFGDITYVIALQPFSGGDNISAGTLAMHTTLHAAAGTRLELHCLNNTGQQTTTAVIRSGELSALRVATLTIQ